MMCFRVRSERGFSLVETLSALVVFSLVTLGIVPVLLTSIRGTNIARSFTQGKNVGLEAMERVRGVPFHIDYGTQPSRVDLLDLYFPNLTAFNPGTCTGYFTATATCASTGHQATKGPGFLTTCPAAGTPMCPAGIPTGHSITYQASFVQDETPPLSTAGDEETYDRAPPPPGYRYNAVGLDIPARLLVEMTITVRWINEGSPRSYELKTLLGERQFGDLKLSASAKVDYAVKVIAGYGTSNASSPPSELVAIAGFSESRIEAKRLSTADNTTRAVEFRLVDADETIPGCPPAPCPGEDMTPPVFGAQATVLSPPDATSPTVNVGDIQISHPNGTYAQVGGADDTSVTDVSAAVAGGTPVANGEWASSPGSADLDLSVINKRSDKNNFDFERDIMVEVRKLPSGTRSITGHALAQAGAIGSGINAEAHAEFGELRLMASDFIDDEDNSSGGAVVAIQNFTATADCDATTNGIADNPEVTYSATLKYWFDPAENDSTTDGRYVTLNLSAAGGADPLAAVKASNPLIYDRNPDSRDVYLFPRTSPVRDGYLEDWSSVRTVSTSVGENGRIVSGSLDGAIDIETRGIEKVGPTQDPNTALGVTMGALSCRAEDRR